MNFLFSPPQIFYIPMALVIPPAVFAVHIQFNLLYQFWIHTEVNIGILDHHGYRTKTSRGVMTGTEEARRPQRLVLGAGGWGVIMVLEQVCEGGPVLEAFV